MPAIASHSTATVDRPWEGPAAVARLSNDAEALRAVHAWRDPSMDPDTKAAYKFPHHAAAAGPANLPAVRNGLARLSQADIPAGDRAGVERHLRRHFEDAQR